MGECRMCGAERALQGESFGRRCGREHIVPFLKLQLEHWDTPLLQRHDVYRRRADGLQRRLFAVEAKVRRRGD